jgi:hypothetical protein
MPTAASLKIARREFPDADIRGLGFYASVSECGGQVVHLHATQEQADRAVDRIDDSGCGGHGCQGRHSSSPVAMHWAVPLDD